MFYIQSNGVKIAVYDPAPSRKKVVLFIHGWPLSYKMYEYQVNLLLDKGYRPISIDLRGFGKSDMPAEGYSYNQMSADIYNVVKALGLSNFTLVGYSMGGAIVLRYMNCFRGYGVNKLMLLAAAAPCWTQRQDFPYGLTKEAVNDLIDLAEKDRPKLCENFANMLFASKHSNAVINWFEEIALSASGYGTIQTCISLRDEDGRADLLAVHVPTAIFQGDKDQVVPNSLTEYQHKHIKNSKLYTFANSGHGIVYDELEKFNETFMNFLESK